MTFAILSHPDCRGHVTPPGHPERVERIEAVEAALSAVMFADVAREEAPLAEETALRRAHPAAHLERIAASEPAEGWISLDPDTHLSPGTLLAARRAAGAAVRAVDMVMGGPLEGGPLDVCATKAFCATRPPGHHAERETAMGFCFYSNAALAALHALEAHGLSCVAVADFDVHHGNGTQDVLSDEARAVYCSSHQWPLYPGTGRESETGAGNIFNAALAPGAGGAAFRRVWEDRLLPAIDAHAPELLIVSAGFDAHASDPLANLELQDDDFAWITGRLCDLADRHCGGRVVSTLEGGYELTALASATTAHAKVLMERAG